MMAAGPWRAPVRKEVVLSMGTGMRTAAALSSEDCSGGSARKLVGVQGTGGICGSGNGRAGGGGLKNGALPLGFAGALVRIEPFQAAIQQPGFHAAQVE